MATSLTPEQDSALAKLVADGVLTAPQGDAVRAALAVDAGVPRRVAEVLGYLGGGLVLAGAALLIGTSWEELSRGARIAVLLVSAAVLLAAGILIAGGTRALPPRVGSARTRVAGVLFALAAVVGGITAATIATSHEGLWATSTMLVLAGCGYLALPSLACLAVAAAGSVAVVWQVVVEVLDADAPWLAGALIVVGVLWGALTAANAVRPGWAGFTVAAVIALIGAQVPLASSEWTVWGYLLTAGVAVAGFVAYRLTRSPVLLAAGVVGFTLAVPEAIWDWTGGSVGGAAIVLIAGAVLLALGGLSLRLRH
ncbi:Predicted membrane protein [Actinokineospora alba]|uniref:Predicted membrane protein n=1 Tax=Actinokineospora alba TaxID=504798 RepID=A0A1H0GAW3_9PSEU|nr:DUF2157 domain-containing protein [Actinokineospora alba]TDP69830.1 hypothetical protein C8E96_5425 [Actinokineospora alba]SDI07745.1 Predicted membrane protein [Actinokineospora alba]SDO04055.1 Predicted membrane protein [Actinokineospora alba]